MVQASKLTVLQCRGQCWLQTCSHESLAAVLTFLHSSHGHDNKSRAKYPVMVNFNLIYKQNKEQQHLSTSLSTSAHTELIQAQIFMEWPTVNTVLSRDRSINSIKPNQGKRRNAQHICRRLLVCMLTHEDKGDLSIKCIQK